MKILTIREFAFFSLVAVIFLLTGKKGWSKRYIYELKKIIFLAYKINYYLIVDRAPQRLYSQHYSYK